jgi:hypothetical protein
MKFRITETEANIGWKETDYGKSSSTIVDYPSIEAMLEGEEFYDENWDDDLDEEEEKTANEYFRMVKAIEENGGFMCDQYERRYWADPEPCDSYLTYGTEFTIEVLSEEEFEKIQKEKEAKLSKKIGENNAKWNKLFKEVETLEGLKTLLKQYNFPNKLKKE